MKDASIDFLGKCTLGGIVVAAVAGGGMTALNIAFENGVLGGAGAIVGTLGVAAVSAGVGYAYIKKVVTKSYENLIIESQLKK